MHLSFVQLSPPLASYEFSPIFTETNACTVCVSSSLVYELEANHILSAILLNSTMGNMTDNKFINKDSFQRISSSEQRDVEHEMPKNSTDEPQLGLGC